MYILVAQSGKTQYNQDEWVIDTVADLETIPKERSNMGSTVFCIETSDVYILNSQRKWVKI